MVLECTVFQWLIFLFPSIATIRLTGGGVKNREPVRVNKISSLRTKRKQERYTTILRKRTIAILLFHHVLVLPSISRICLGRGYSYSLYPCTVATFEQSVRQEAVAFPSGPSGNLYHGND